MAREISFEEAMRLKEQGKLGALTPASEKPREALGLPETTGNLLADIERDAASFGLKLSSGHRSPEQNRRAGGARGSYHLTGQARDFAGSPDQMLAFSRHVRGRYGKNLAELFYDPLGAMKHGQDLMGPIGGHADHVHVAYTGANVPAASPSLAPNELSFEQALKLKKAGKLGPLKPAQEITQPQPAMTPAIPALGQAKVVARPPVPPPGSRYRTGVYLSPFTGEAVRPRKGMERVGRAIGGFFGSGTEIDKATNAYYAAAEANPKIAPPLAPITPQEKAQSKTALATAKKIYDDAAGVFETRLRDIDQTLGESLKYAQLAAPAKAKGLQAQIDKAREKAKSDFRKAVSASAMARALKSEGPIPPYQQRMIPSLGAAFDALADSYGDRYFAGVVNAAGTAAGEGVGMAAAPLVAPALKKAAAPVIARVGGAMTARAPGLSAGVQAAGRSVPGRVAKKILALDEDKARDVIAGFIQQPSAYVATTDPKDITADRVIAEALTGAAGGYLFNSGIRLTRFGYDKLRHIVRDNPNVATVTQALETLAGEPAAAVRTRKTAPKGTAVQEVRKATLGEWVSARAAKGDIEGHVVARANGNVTLQTPNGAKITVPEAQVQTPKTPAPAPMPRTGTVDGGGALRPKGRPKTPERKASPDEPLETRWWEAEEIPLTKVQRDRYDAVSEEIIRRYQATTDPQLQDAINAEGRAALEKIIKEAKAPKPSGKPTVRREPRPANETPEQRADRIIAQVEPGAPTRKPLDAKALRAEADAEIVAARAPVDQVAPSEPKLTRPAEPVHVPETAASGPAEATAPKTGPPSLSERVVELQRRVAEVDAETTGKLDAAKKGAAKVEAKTWAPEGEERFRFRDFDTAEPRLQFGKKKPLTPEETHDLLALGRSVIDNRNWRDEGAFEKTYGEIGEERFDRVYRHLDTDEGRAAVESYFGRLDEIEEAAAAKDVQAAPKSTQSTPLQLLARARELGNPTPEGHRRLPMLGEGDSQLGIDTGFTQSDLDTLYQRLNTKSRASKEYTLAGSKYSLKALIYDAKTLPNDAAVPKSRKMKGVTKVVASEAPAPVSAPVPKAKSAAASPAPAASKPKRTASARAATAKLRAEADAVIKEYPPTLPGKGKGGRSGAALPPRLLAAYAKRVVADVADGALTAADFAEKMVREFGEEIRPHLNAIWQAARSQWDELRKAHDLDEWDAATKGKPDAVQERDTLKNATPRNANIVQAREQAQPGVNREAAPNTQSTIRPRRSSSERVRGEADRGSASKESRNEAQERSGQSPKNGERERAPLLASDDRNRLSLRASDRDGEASRSPSREERARASQERGQLGQQAGKPRTSEPGRASGETPRATEEDARGQQTSRGSVVKGPSSMRSVRERGISPRGEGQVPEVSQPNIGKGVSGQTEVAPKPKSLRGTMTREEVLAYERERPQTTGLANQKQSREVAEGVLLREPRRVKGIGRRAAAATAKAEVEAGGKTLEDIVRLADKIGRGERAFNRGDVALLTEGKRALLKDLNTTRAELDSAIKAGSSSPFVAGRQKAWQEAQVKLQKFADDVQQGKTGWSDIGRELQIGIDVDYGNFAEVLLEASRRAGRQISEESREGKALKAISDKLDEVQVKLKEMESLPFEEIRREATRKARRRPASTRTREQIARSKQIHAEKLKRLLQENAPKLNVRLGSGLGGVEVDASRLKEAAPEIHAELGALAKDVWEEGVVGLKDLVQKVRTILGDAKGITDSDIIHAWNDAAEPGKSPDEIARGKSQATRERNRFIELEDRLAKGETLTAPEAKERRELLESHKALEAADALNRRVAQLEARKAKLLEGPQSTLREPPVDEDPRVKALLDEIKEIHKAQKEARQFAEAARSLPAEEAEKAARKARNEESAFKRKLQEKAEAIQKARAETVAERAERRAQQKAEWEASRAERADELKELDAELEAVRKEAALADQEAALDRQIAEQQELLDKGDWSQGPGQKRQLQESVRSKQSQLRKMQAERRLQGQIELLKSHTMVDGPSSMLPKAEKDVSEKMLNLRAERSYLENQIKANLQELSKSKLQRGLETITSLPRVLKATGDNSGFGRQALLLYWINPRSAWPSLRDSVRAALNPVTAERIRMEIMDRENAPLYIRAGLAPEFAGEELFQGTNPLKVLRPFDRAYSTILNRARADAFDSMIRWAGSKDEATIKDIGHAINSFSGRGGTRSERFTKGASLASLALFSPRFMVSRLETAAGVPLWMAMKNPYAKKAIARAYIQMIGAYSALWTANYIAGVAREEGQEYDPRSSDWGKAKFDRTRSDFTAGIAQIHTLLAREILNSTKNKRGVEGMPREGFSKEGYKYEVNRLTLLKDFGTNKLAPIPSAVGQYLGGKSWYDRQQTGLPEKYKEPELARDLFIPLPFVEIYQGLLDQGWDKNDAQSLIGNLVGFSSQTYKD